MLSALIAFPAQALGQKTHRSAVTNKFNIYHLVFDAYHGPWLQFAMSELALTNDAFPGFTHYRFARSNYWDTDASFPSFLSGTLYQPKMSVRDWHKDAETKSLLRDLTARGYETTAYALFTRPGFKNPAKFIAPSEGTVSLPLLLDYWSLRVAPVGLRHLLPASGPFTRVASLMSPRPTGDTRGYDSYELFQQLLADELTRPDSSQYIMMHSYVPHGPYQMDRRGKFVGKSSYDEQLLLATRMMQDLVVRLKESGRYDHSLIIFQSDHGTQNADDAKYERQPLRAGLLRMDKEISAAIESVDVRASPGRQIEARSSALLLIKAPIACSSETTDEMQIVDALTQLKDLKAYLLSALSNTKAACRFPTALNVDFYNGLVTQGRTGRLTVGSDIFFGKINNYEVRTGFDWRIKEDLPFRY